MDQAHAKIAQLKLAIKFKIGSYSEEFFINASRQTYLPCLLSKLNRFLEKIDKPILSIETTWFSSKKIPLKWHYPIGLLYDILNINTNIWEVEVNTEEFPFDKILRIDGEKAMNVLFMSMEKEADSIRTGSIKKTMSLSEKDIQLIWSYVQGDDIDLGEYLKVHKDLLVLDEYRSIPLRVYLDDGSVVRKLIAKFGILQEVMEELKIADYRLVLHGIDLSKETPIVWLYQNAAFADTFLHIVAHKI